MPGAPAIEFCDHRRLAKKRARAIIYMRGKEKNARLYRDLIKATTNTLGYLERAEMVLRAGHVAELPVAPWHVQVTITSH